MQGNMTLGNNHYPRNALVIRHQPRIAKNIGLGDFRHPNQARDFIEQAKAQIEIIQLVNRAIRQIQHHVKTEALLVFQFINPPI